MSASVLIDLDTTAPVLKVTAPEAVEPPDDVVLVIEASERFGVVSVVLTDGLQMVTNLGYEWRSERSLVLRVPTVGVASGPASLRIEVADEVLNSAEALVHVRIERPRIFDVVLTLDPGYTIEPSLDHAYDMESLMDSGYTVFLTRDRGYEADLDLEPTYDITLEVY